MLIETTVENYFRQSGKYLFSLCFRKLFLIFDCFAETPKTILRTYCCSINVNNFATQSMRRSFLQRKINYSMTLASRIKTAE